MISIIIRTRMTLMILASAFLFICVSNALAQVEPLPNPFPASRFILAGSGEEIEERGWVVQRAYDPVEYSIVFAHFGQLRILTAELPEGYDPAPILGRPVLITAVRSWNYPRYEKYEGSDDAFHYEGYSTLSVKEVRKLDDQRSTNND